MSAAALLAALILGGCGLTTGAAPTAVELLVTRDFGAHVLHGSGAIKTAGQESVMSLLRRYYPVDSKDGGVRVRSIDGFSGGREAGAPVDWFYYVNGVQASGGPTATSVHPGDHIWWDRHDWGAAEEIPAVVGSFPEPFLNGLDGKRLPVRIECANDAASACAAVTARLRKLGVPAAIAAIGSGGEPETLRVIVASWSALAGELAAQEIERGPGVSGVYARFSAAGQTLTLLDQNGRPARTLSAGAGLIAATRRVKEAPVWLITGTDEAGVDLAARAFDQRTLQDHFAVALTPSGSLALPVGGG